MKYLLFFTVLGLFVWIAIVPPDGMSKYPAVNVEFDAEDWRGMMKFDVNNSFKEAPASAKATAGREEEEEES